MIISSFRIIFITSISALIIAPIIFRVSRRMGFVDVPNSAPHKHHSSSKPIAGGIIVILSVIAVGFWQDIWDFQTLRAIIISSLIIFAFGIWDDIKELPAPIKLGGQIIAALAVMHLGVQVLLFHQKWINQALTLLWIVGITNAYNFVDSMDGLAIGLAAQASAFFMLVSFESGQSALSVFSAVLLGACLGCFYYNALPAHFFLGDSGSQLLGFLLAALAIAYNPPGYERAASWYIPILLMGVPLFDLALVVVSRLRRRRPIYKGAHDHTYHRLVSIGMGPNRAVLSMHLVALLLGCMAFIALDLPPLMSNLVFGATLIIGIIALFYIDSKKVWSEPD